MMLLIVVALMPLTAASAVPASGAVPAAGAVPATAAEDHLARCDNVEYAAVNYPLCCSDGAHVTRSSICAKASKVYKKNDKLDCDKEEIAALHYGKCCSKGAHASRPEVCRKAAEVHKAKTSKAEKAQRDSASATTINCDSRVSTAMVRRGHPNPSRAPLESLSLHPLHRTMQCSTMRCAARKGNGKSTWTPARPCARPTKAPRQNARTQSTLSSTMESAAHVAPTRYQATARRAKVPDQR